jgi:hypothetical protein
MKTKEKSCYFVRFNLDQSVSIDLKQKKICFAQLTSGSDLLIAVNRVRSIKVDQMQNPKNYIIIKPLSDCKQLTRPSVYIGQGFKNGLVRCVAKESDDFIASSTERTSCNLSLAPISLD